MGWVEPAQSLWPLPIWLSQLHFYCTHTHTLPLAVVATVTPFQSQEHSKCHLTMKGDWRHTRAEAVALSQVARSTAQ